MNKHLSVISFVFIKIMINLIGIVRSKVLSIFWGKATIGVLGQLLAFYQLQNMAIKGGSSATLINYITKSEEETKKHAIQAVFLLILAGLSIYLLLTLTFVEALAFYLFKSAEYTHYLFWIIWVGPLFIFYWLLQTIHQGEKNFAVLVRGQVIALSCALIAIVPLVYYWGISGFIIDLVIWYFVGILFLGQGKLHLFLIRPSDLRPIKVLLPNVFGDCMAMLFRNIIIYCALLGFRVWVVQLMDLTEAGSFQSLWSISNYVQVLVQGFVFYLFPTMSAVQEDDKFNQELNGNLRLLVYVLMPLLVILSSVPDLLLYVLYSEEFVSAAPQLGWMFFGRMFEALFQFYTILLLAQNRLKVFVSIEVFRSILLITLPSWLIAMFNLNGAVAGIVLVYVISGVLIVGVGQRDQKMRLSGETIKLFMTFLLAILAIILVPLDWDYAFLIRLAIGAGFIVFALDLNKYRELSRMLISRITKK